MTYSAEKLSPVVLKFGGSSVAEVKHWKTIVARLHHEIQQQRRPIVVLSALKDVSNQLESILHKAVLGEFKSDIAALLNKHLEFADALGLNIDSLLIPYAERLSQLCHKINQANQISPKLHASVLAIGELWSTTIGCAFINRSKLVAEWIDVRQILKSIEQQDEWHHFTSAECEFKYQPNLLAQLFAANHKAQVVVTQGFIAADTNGNTVLLGREGSDTSAAYLAAKLGARQLQIWTDVSGVFSANPAEIPTAKPIVQLSYSQAHTMAKLGAKVLHPKVIRPLATNQIALQVKSTWWPQKQGTDIGNLFQQPQKIIAVIATRECVLLKIPEQWITKLDRKFDRSILSSLGFDIILEEFSRGWLLITLKYMNTDNPMPSLADLASQLDLDSSMIYLRGQLISVVGAENDKAWMVEASTLMVSLIGCEGCAKFVSEEQGRISFYLEQSENETIVRELHDKLFPQ
jgi:bifunctional diaminopimelate decarboxylase / aspartate kinase